MPPSPVLFFEEPRIALVAPTFVLLHWSPPRWEPPLPPSSAAAATHTVSPSSWRYTVQWAWTDESTTASPVSSPIAHRLAVIPRGAFDTLLAVSIVASQAPSEIALAGGPDPYGTSSGSGGLRLRQVSWRRMIDLLRDEDAVAAAVALSSLPSPIAPSPMTASAAATPSIPRTAADLARTALLPIFVALAAAAPTGCLGAVPDSLALLGSLPADIVALTKSAARGTGADMEGVPLSLCAAPVLLGQGAVSGYGLVGLTLPVRGFHRKTAGAAGAEGGDTNTVLVHCIVTMDDLSSREVAAMTGSPSRSTSAAALALRDALKVPFDAAAAAHRPSSVLRSAMLEELLRTDPTALLVFVGAHTAAAHKCALSTLSAPTAEVGIKDRVFSIVLDGPLLSCGPSASSAPPAAARYVAQMLSIATAAASPDECVRLAGFTQGGLSAAPSGLVGGIQYAGSHCFGATLLAPGALGGNAVMPAPSAALPGRPAVRQTPASSPAQASAPSAALDTQLLLVPLGLVGCFTPSIDGRVALFTEVAALRPYPAGSALASLGGDWQATGGAGPPLAQHVAHTVSAGAVSGITLFSEDTLLHALATSTGASAADCAQRLAPSIASVRAAVVDDVVVRIAIDGRYVGLRPLVTAQGDRPLLTPPIEPLLACIGPHRVVAEFPLEHIFSLQPCIETLELSLLLSTPFGTQHAQGVELVVPGEWRSLASDLGAPVAERQWALAAAPVELVSGALQVEPFFCSLVGSHGQSQRLLAALESIADIIGESAGRKQGIFNRISNAASRVASGRRPLTLAAPSKNEVISRMLADHGRSNRDIRMLLSQLNPWKAKIHAALPWMLKGGEYEARLDRALAMLLEMEHAAVAIAGCDASFAAGGAEPLKASIGGEVVDGAAATAPREARVGGLSNNDLTPLFADPIARSTKAGAPSSMPPSPQQQQKQLQPPKRLPLLYREALVNSLTLRLLRRCTSDRHHSGTTYEEGHAPALAAPHRFAADDVIALVTSFDHFHGLLWPIFNTHRAFADLSSEQLLAEIAALWCVLVFYHLRTTYLLTRHVVIMGPPKSGLSTLCNAIKQTRHAFGRRRFAGSQKVRSVAIRELRRVDELSAATTSGIASTVCVACEAGDIGAPSFHSSFLKPLRAHCRRHLNRVLLFVNKADEWLLELVRDDADEGLWEGLRSAATASASAATATKTASSVASCLLELLDHTLTRRVAADAVLGAWTREGWLTIAPVALNVNRTLVEQAMEVAIPQLQAAFPDQPTTAEAETQRFLELLASRSQQLLKDALPIN